jgi:hypothetical protein
VAVLIIAGAGAGAGAGAATAGRFVLARAFRRFGRKLPAKRTESLEVLGRAVAQSKGGLVSTFLFFVFAPVPSAQMFEAAGLAKVRLGPLLAAFFIGRLVSYSLYVGAASAARSGLEKLFQNGLTSPQAIATQLISIALLVVFVKVDWPSTIDRLVASVPVTISHEPRTMVTRAGQAPEHDVPPFASEAAPAARSQPAERALGDGPVTAAAVARRRASSGHPGRGAPEGAGSCSARPPTRRGARRRSLHR